MSGWFVVVSLPLVTCHLGDWMMFVFKKGSELYWHTPNHVTQVEMIMWGVSQLEHPFWMWTFAHLWETKSTGRIHLVGIYAHFRQWYLLTWLKMLCHARAHCKLFSHGRGKLAWPWKTHGCFDCYPSQKKHWIDCEGSADEETKTVFLCFNRRDIYGRMAAQVHSSIGGTRNMEPRNLSSTNISGLLTIRSLNLLIYLSWNKAHFKCWTIQQVLTVAVHFSCYQTSFNLSGYPSIVLSHIFSMWFVKRA